MGILSVRLPESLHQGVRELAQREGISINQFIATAVAEKLATLMSFKPASRPAWMTSISRISGTPLG